MYDRISEDALNVIVGKMREEIIQHIVDYAHEDDTDADAIVDAGQQIIDARKATTLREVGDVIKNEAWDFESFVLCLAAHEQDPQFANILRGENDGWDESSLLLLCERYGMFDNTIDAREWGQGFDT